ncbi:hypothetical protein Ccrd_010303 [Cynara cardunculus var. scolymus]|uniref:Uncharacterized protein n=1 Tax=Cynara cardunculus var. scolymus TaxID=59895 RepID=A0A103YLJ4_CYNCS|nr:hypothetical protein Ccrd_010303 [Cynara cardunculus var. scolymus]
MPLELGGMWRIFRMVVWLFASFSISRCFVKGMHTCTSQLKRI